MKSGVLTAPPRSSTLKSVVCHLHIGVKRTTRRNGGLGILFRATRDHSRMVANRNVNRGPLAFRVGADSKHS